MPLVLWWWQVAPGITAPTPTAPGLLPVLPGIEPAMYLLGSVLAWLMWKVTSDLQQLRLAQDRLTRAMLVDIMARHEHQHPVHQQAARILEEVPRTGTSSS